MSKEKKNEISFPWRKLRINGAVSVRSKFESFPIALVSQGSGSVHVRLAEDYHPNVGVEVNPAGLAADEPQVDQVPQVLVVVFLLERRLLFLDENVLALAGGHVESALAEEGVRVGGHVVEVVNNHEHLDHRPQRIEKRHLDGP